MAAIWDFVSETKQRTDFAVAKDILACAAPAGTEAASIGRALVVITDARSAAVFLRDPRGVVACPWSHNLSDAYVRQLVTPQGVNPWSHLMRTPEIACMDMVNRARTHDPKAWFLCDVSQLPRTNTVRRRIERERLRSVCAWPLVAGGQVIGAIAYYYDAPHVHAASEEEIMRAFVIQAAAILPEGVAARRRREGRRGAGFGGAELTQADAVETATAHGDDLSAVRRELVAEEMRLAAERISLEMEQRRLADARADVDAENERLAAMRRRLDADTAQIAAEREEMDVDRGRRTETQILLDPEPAPLRRA
ncbi:MAG TPA: GAF domain-containing protein [bacterium]|nr:GAF domain-containing protein [bacterium]